MTAENDVVVGDGTRDGLRVSRFRVPRSRGALSGVMLLILGAWAGVVPFIGPYLNFAFTPAPNTAWYWTASRGWLDVAPGAAAFVAGLVLLLGTNRVTLTFASWLGIASGAWLVIGPVLAAWMGINAGAPDPGSNFGVRTLEALLFYYALGAAILLFAATALGRVSVHGVRDVRAGQRRVEAEAAREAGERRLAEQRLAQERAAGEQTSDERAAERDGQSTVARHERRTGEESSDYAPTTSYPSQAGPAETG